MEYEIKTIMDILRVVNHNNLDNFLKDFEVFLTQYVILKAMDENLECKEFIWIDDNNQKIEITLTHK